MSHIIPIKKVDQFLPKEKLSLDTSIDQESGVAVDHHKIDDLEETGRDIVWAQLSAVYDVSTWSGPTSIPSLVQNILGLLVAGWVYDRQFSEEATAAGGYGQRRVREANALINQLLEGTLVLDDADMLDEDGPGSASVLETEPVFIMGEQF